jgi:hypothetical protein
LLCVMLCTPIMTSCCASMHCIRYVGVVIDWTYVDLFLFHFYETLRALQWDTETGSISPRLQAYQLWHVKGIEATSYHHGGALWIHGGCRLSHRVPDWNLQHLIARVIISRERDYLLVIFNKSTRYAKVIKFTKMYFDHLGIQDTQT